MSTILCFSSVEELDVAFKDGISVVFVKPGAYLRNRLILDHATRRSTIRIATTLEEMKHSNGSLGMDLLEEQKVTLIHELIHLFISFRLKDCYLSYQYHEFNMKMKDFELAIDTHAYAIVRFQPNLLEDIVCQLTLSQKCTIEYEVEQTPFRRFHLSIIHDKILGNLRFGDPRQIEILNLIRPRQLNY